VLPVFGVGLGGWKALSGCPPPEPLCRDDRPIWYHTGGRLFSANPFNDAPELVC